MKPVAAYVRMSTDMQRYSIENQLLAIEAYCAVNDLALVRTYSDAGKSGVSLENRPGLRSLVDEAERGGLPFANVIVFDVSRWGRFQNVDEGAYYEHVLRRAGAPVVYCAEGFENDGSPMAMIVKSVKQAMAAEFSRDLSRRIALAKRRIAKTGARCGALAGYGYRRAVVDEDGSLLGLPQHGEWIAPGRGRATLVLGPVAEVNAVRRIFTLFVVKGVNIMGIARMMELENWPPPASGSWKRGVVTGILRNEKYAGVAVYGKTRRPLGGRWSRSPETDWVRVEDAYPAMVSKRRFRAAQSVRSGQRKYGASDYLPGLRALYARHGTVTGRLVAQDPSLPGATTLWRLFGSMRAACRAAGLPGQSLGEKRLILNAARKARQWKGHESS